MVEPSFDCSKLASEWDGNEDIRYRVRKSGGPLVREVPGVKKKSADASIAERTLNADVLQPCLHRLFAAQLKLPEIDRLRDEVESMYLDNQRHVEDSVVDDNAWDLRKMLRFVKRKARREEPSLATKLRIRLLSIKFCILLF